MINSRNQLLILEDFRVNNNLPKFNKKTSNNDTISINTGSFVIGSSTTTALNWPQNPNDLMGDTESSIQDSNGRLVRLENKKQNWIVRQFNKLFVDKFHEKKKTKTIVEFFSTLATSLNELPVLAELGSYYEQSISNAKSANQTALFDSLTQKYGIVKSESVLIAKDLKKYLTEQQIVKFYEKTEKDKNLKLTWINNYIRPIPTTLVELKNNLDLLEVFDNYVILHYDPQNNSTDLTEQEKIRKKDSILFGLIRNSRKLYYIGDWIDEYCDLTLEKLIETVKSDVNEINNDSVKTFINNK
jgi:hypothetical protein